MKILIQNLTLPIDEDSLELLGERVLRRLGLKKSDIIRFRVVKKSLDARQSPLKFKYQVEVETDNSLALKSFAEQDNIVILKEPEKQESMPQLAETSSGRPVIVGMGPAGIFCALTLLEYGIKPIILEKGKPVEERILDCQTLLKEGVINPVSNLCFGEGGAGTYSDGKLTTRKNHPRIKKVYQWLVEFGLDEEIFIEAKPHIGSDRLVIFLQKVRKYLQSRGCELRYNSRVTELILSGEAVIGVRTASEEISSDWVVLATGQHDRALFEMLGHNGVPMSAKDFAIGVRIEHPQSLINQIQYKQHWNHPKLEAASYSLTARVSERGVYSFCMCPGGKVVPACPDSGYMVVNGMSYSKRDLPFANSALVVSVTPQDFSDSSPLGGLFFRNLIEQKVAQMAPHPCWAPAQNLTDFLADRPTKALNPSSYTPGLFSMEIKNILPAPVVWALKKGLPLFDQQMKGFISEAATLIGVETRTSSPVRILRDQSFQSLRYKGLFPIGEGAGYAGGIMSSALDGILCAQVLGDLMVSL